MTIMDSMYCLLESLFLIVYQPLQYDMSGYGIILDKECPSSTLHRSEVQWIMNGIIQEINNHRYTRAP